MSLARYKEKLEITNPERKEKTMNLVQKILSEDNGNLSTMRVLVGLVVVTVLFNWTYFNVTQHQLVGFAWQDLGTLFLPLLAKAYQKGKES
jgi:hypothetical protein